MPQVASKISYTAIPSAIVTEISSDSIKVFGVCLSNGGFLSRKIICRDNNGDTLIYISVPARSTSEFKGVWLANNGLHVLNPGGDIGDLTITVIYSGTG